MSDEWNKGYFSTGPQHSHDARLGQFARQQEQQRERDAAARAARERDQRSQDQMIRDALWTASRPAGTDADRIFSRQSRRGGGGAGLVIAAGVLLFVLVADWNGIRSTLIRAVPAQHRPPPGAVPAAGEPLNPAVASVAERATAGPAMPPMDRFALRRLELVHGDTLDLLVSWQLPDGARRAATMDASIVTRDLARHRTPLLERWSVFPGDSTIPLALPAGLLPGKYELETVWTLGGEARELRTQFTVLERPIASSAGTPSPLPLPPVPAHTEVATVATSAPLAPESNPAPPIEQAPAPERAPPAALGTPPFRPRSPANDQLYTGG
jgi:hypothetical protein